MFHGDDNEYVPLRITLLDVTGFYNIFQGGSKTINFMLNDDLLVKIIDISEDIGKELNIDLDNYFYDGKRGIYSKSR